MLDLVVGGGIEAQEDTVQCLDVGDQEKNGVGDDVRLRVRPRATILVNTSNIFCHKC